MTITIGIYIRNLAPPSPASARFQETILEGLKSVVAPQFRFAVLSEEIPPEYEDTDTIRFVALARATPAEASARRRKLLVGGAARWLLRRGGLSKSRLYERIAGWLAYEPPYYRQLRDLNLRLIWNSGVDVLPSFLPFSMVVWDCNYRIHPMFPEYSYATDGYRFFDQHTPLLSQASYVIVGTEQGKREVVEVFGVYSGKVRVIALATPSLPPPSESRRRLATGEYLYYPARLWPHKNHIVLLRALGLLRHRFAIRIRCVFSGIDNGNLDYILKVADDLGIDDQIDYLGNVSLPELSDLYRGAAVLAYCSAVGPDNFPPLEAMSVGCPVVAADVPGAREQYGDAVLYFDPTNEEELALRLKDLLRDPVLRSSMVNKGLERAARWTPRHYAESMIQVLEEFARIARMWERCDFQPRF